MARPSDPQKKVELLERCLAAAIETGELGGSINQIAARVGTSGRMLVYHFGSKQELERQVIARLEERLRETLWSFQSVPEEGGQGLKPALMDMWRHLMAPNMRGLLKLTMELNQRAMQGEEETRQFLERESQQWIDYLSELTHDSTIAVPLFCVFQGAILDVLTTGNVRRGEQAIQAFIDNWQ
ncbi:MAG: TetR/AcrR family transcriptional regulator [Cyanobacteria bacterium P01_E01_bin.34]